MRRKLHIMIIFTLSLVWLILPQGLCLGATYYFDAVNGDDFTGNGTSLAPWQTLVKAQAEAQPGDTVILRNGEYGDFIEENVTRLDWVTYRAADGHTPVFTRIFIYNETQQDAYLRFENITVEIPVTWYTDNGYVTSQPNNWPDDPQGGPFTHTNHVVSILSANYVHLKNCAVKGINKYLTSYGVYVLNSDYVTVEHCDVSVVERPLRAIDSHYYTTKYNHLHNHSSGSALGVQTRTSNKANADKILGAVIEYNHIHDQHSDPNDDYFPSGFHGGSGIAIRHSNVVVRGNIIHDLYGQGIKFYEDYATYASDPNTAMAPHINMLVENNLVYDVSNYNAFDYLGGSCLIRNNTFIGKVDRDDHSGGIYPAILNRYGGNPFYVGFVSDFDGSGVEIHNNIVVGQWNLPDPNDPNANKYIEDYNIWWGKDWNAGKNDLSGPNSIVAVWFDSGLHGYPEFFEDLDGFTQWTPEYPEGSNHTPFFVNPGFYTKWEPGLDADTGKVWDYNLAAGSPGINFGDSSKQPSTSLGTIGPDGFIRNDGQARDASHHSVGCYEYGPYQKPPVTNAGPDQTVIDEDNNGSEEVTLDGSASFDPDGTIVSFIWSEGGSQIATGVNPTAILSTGTHLITLTVTDNKGLTDTDTVTIKVLKEDKEFGKLPTGCYNNVFNPTKGERALIVVEIKERAHIKLDLYNTKGNKIKELVDEEKEAEVHTYYWYGKDDSGNTVGSGIYFVHMEAGGYKETKKIAVVR